MIRVDDRRQLDQVLKDASIKTLVVVRGDAACAALADGVETRTQGFPWRGVVRLPTTGIINASEGQRWFGADPHVCGVVLGGVGENRPVVAFLRADMSLMEIDDALLEADGR